MAWCFDLKSGQKVILLNYCLKNYIDYFLAKKIVTRGYYKNEGFIRSLGS